MVKALMRKHGWGFEKALAVAKKIEADRKERVAKMKKELARSQGLLDLDGTGPKEEPADRFVETDATINF